MDKLLKYLIKDNVQLQDGNLPSIIKDAILGTQPLNSKILLLILNIIKKIDNDVLYDLSRNFLKYGYYDGKDKMLLTAYNSILKYFTEIKFTQFDIAKEQIDEYEKLYGWNPKDKFLFPSNNFGIYSLMVIHRLMNSESMQAFIKDDFQRYKFIIERQIFITDKSPINNFIYHILVDIGREFENNIFTGDFLSYNFDNYMHNLGIKKFTAVFCDPEYIEMTKYKKRSNQYIYHKYALKAIECSNKLVFLSPSRWLQTTSSELNYLKKFREKLRTSKHIRLIKTYNINSTKDKNLINNGGLSYFIYDEAYIGKCSINGIPVDTSKFDIILTDGRFAKFIEKISKNTVSILDRYISSCWSGIKSNDKRLSEKGYFKVHVSNRKNKNGHLWIKEDYIKFRYPINLYSWKVFIPETVSLSSKGFAKDFRIGMPYDVCTETFCGFITQTEDESISLISYLKTNFANKLISIRKIKNHINKETLKWLPSVPLDRIWTNEEICDYFRLTKEEQKLFEN
jgi:hypothetical protein